MELDSGGAVRRGRSRTQLGKRVFTDMREFSWGSGFNTLAKEPGKQYEHAARIVLRSLENAITYTK